MIVGIAVYEIHIPHAQSLKDKRSVVRSLRDRIRQRFEVSAAEVGLQDLHQRARLAVAAVGSDGAAIEPILGQIADLIENAGEAILAGWNGEIIPFDESAPLDGAKYE